MVVRKKDVGQNLVEFSLVMVFLLMVAFGVLDLGRAFFTAITISNAAREGARYLTTHPTDNLSTPAYVGTINAATEEAQGSIFNIQSSDVVVKGRLGVSNVEFNGCVDSDGTNGCDSGATVIVTVNYEYEPIMGWFMQGPIHLSRSVEMIMP